MPDQPRSPARVHCWMKRPLAPCGQGSRPTASTNELAIDDIVELGVPVAPVIQPATEKDTALPEPQEAPLPPVLPAGDGEAAAQEQPGPAIPETPEQEPALPTKDGQKGPLQDAEQESEASDEAIRALLTELDEALERAIQGEQSGDAQMVCQAAAHIGRLAETYDLRVLDDPARCLEEVACSGNMDEIVQLMPDLVSAINRNRASFEEAMDGQRHIPEQRGFEGEEGEGAFLKKGPFPKPANARSIFLPKASGCGFCPQAFPTQTAIETPFLFRVGSRHTPFQSPPAASRDGLGVGITTTSESHPARSPSSPEELRISPQSARRVAG
ncbi:MAG: hypothetical protein ACLT2T_06350 [Bilophila wadsworthia]